MELGSHAVKYPWNLFSRLINWTVLYMPCNCHLFFCCAFGENKFCGSLVVLCICQKKLFLFWLEISLSSACIHAIFVLDCKVVFTVAGSLRNARFSPIQPVCCAPYRMNHRMLKLPAAVWALLVGMWKVTVLWADRVRRKNAPLFSSEHLQISVYCHGAGSVSKFVCYAM